jgi:stringent starvation protein B
MIPLRPYLIRAVYEWTIDNGYTPHILVQADAEGVKVPADYVRDGRITLNVHPQAVKDLDLGNEWVSFSARFGGQSFPVEVPVSAVIAAFARENGRGMFFQEEPPEQPSPDKPTGTTSGATKKGPQLKLVK